MQVEVPPPFPLGSLPFLPAVGGEGRHCSPLPPSLITAQSLSWSLWKPGFCQHPRGRGRGGPAN